MTVGIELLLAMDIRIAATTARFAQIEIKRGIYPVGGATLRFPREVGWGNAMRWLLTGDEFDAAEALRIGMVQEVVARDALLDRAVALATVIAAQAPLGVYDAGVVARRDPVGRARGGHAPDARPRADHEVRRRRRGHARVPRAPAGHVQRALTAHGYA